MRESTYGKAVKIPRKLVKWETVKLRIRKKDKKTKRRPKTND